jgi:hypothetical protein
LGSERGPRREPPLPRGLVIALGQATGLVVSGRPEDRRTLHRCGTVPGSHRTSLQRASGTLAQDGLHSEAHALCLRPTLDARRPTDDPTDHHRRPAPRRLRRAESLLLVNTGDGKGKSTAAFGVMLRALARGWQVAVVQFVKSGDWKVGEEKIGRQLGVTWHAGDGFTWDSDDLEPRPRSPATPGRGGRAHRRRRAPSW